MLIIIILCCINLSIIINNSDEVGSASVSIGKYLFSVPEGFNLDENNGNSAMIKNKNNTNIYVETNLNEYDTYKERLNHLGNETNSTILSKGTVSIENLPVSTVYYRTEYDNMSAFYFEKDNTQFKIIVSNFDYDNERDSILEYATFIIKSIKYDYKSTK